MRTSWFFLFSFFLISAASKNKKSGYYSTREHCRMEVSGFYLNLLHEAQSTQQEADILSLKLDRVKQTKEKEEKILAEWNAKLIPGQPQSEWEERIEAKKTTLASLSNAMSQFVKTITTLEKAIEDKQGKAQEYLGAVQTVFQRVIVTLPGKRETYQIVYRESCPKFRENCSLSQVAKKALSKINQDGFYLPDSCKAYIEL